MLDVPKRKYFFFVFTFYTRFIGCRQFIHMNLFSCFSYLSLQSLSGPDSLYPWIYSFVLRIFLYKVCLVQIVYTHGFILLFFVSSSIKFIGCRYLYSWIYCFELRIFLYKVYRVQIVYTHGFILLLFVSFSTKFLGSRQFIHGFVLLFLVTFLRTLNHQ